MCDKSEKTDYAIFFNQITLVGMGAGVHEINEQQHARSGIITQATFYRSTKTLIGRASQPLAHVREGVAGKPLISLS